MGGSVRRAENGGGRCGVEAEDKVQENGDRLGALVTRLAAMGIDVRCDHKEGSPRTRIVATKGIAEARVDVMAGAPIKVDAVAALVVQKLHDSHVDAVLPSGSARLDDTLSIGGYMRGRMVEIAGAGGALARVVVRKLGLLAIREARAAGRQVALIDCARSFERGGDLWSHASELGLLEVDVGLGGERARVTAPENVGAFVALLHREMLAGAALVVIDELDGLLLREMERLNPRAAVRDAVEQRTADTLRFALDREWAKLLGVAQKVRCTVMFVGAVEDHRVAERASARLAPTGLQTWSSMRLGVRVEAVPRKEAGHGGYGAAICVRKNQAGKAFARCYLEETIAWWPDPECNCTCVSWDAAKCGGIGLQARGEPCPCRECHAGDGYPTAEDLDRLARSADAAIKIDALDGASTVLGALADASAELHRALIVPAEMLRAPAPPPPPSAPATVREPRISLNAGRYDPVPSARARDHGGDKPASYAMIAEVIGERRPTLAAERCGTVPPEPDGSPRVDEEPGKAEVRPRRAATHDGAEEDAAEAGAPAAWQLVAGATDEERGDR